jgi:nitrile hydratase subunit beta
MDGIADMGGSEGWGTTHPPIGDEPAFHEPWQARAFALTSFSIPLAGGNLDTFRHAVERLDRTAYLSDGYAGRWINGAELMLTENGLLAPSAIEARARNLRGEQIAEPPAPQPVTRDYVATAEGSLRVVDRAPAFEGGEQVRIKNMSRAGHTRLPRYVRGHVGTVTQIQPAFVFPDTNAHFEGENPQYVYTVRFDSRELWGTDSEPFALTIEMFESYLRKCA